MSFVQLSDGVEAAMSRLDEVGRAALHDDAQVRRVRIVETFDALTRSFDETLVGVFGDSGVDSVVQGIG